MPAWSGASAFCRSSRGSSAYCYCWEASPAPGYARGASGSVRPDRARNAVKCALRQFSNQQPRRIDRTRQGRPPARNALEAAFLIISFVADQNDEAMAPRLRCHERAFDQSLSYATIAKCRLDRHRTQQQPLGLTDANGRKPDRADQQGPDTGRERQFANVFDLLAQPVCRFGVTSRTERAFVQALDRDCIVRRLGLDAH